MASKNHATASAPTGYLRAHPTKSLRCRRSILHLWRGDALPVVHGEEQIVSETVDAMAAVASPVVIKLCRLGKPHFYCVFAEINRHILRDCDQQASGSPAKER